MDHQDFKEITIGRRAGGAGGGGGGSAKAAKDPKAVAAVRANIDVIHSSSHDDDGRHH